MAYEYEYEPQEDYFEAYSYNDGSGEYGSFEDEIDTGYTDWDTTYPAYLDFEPSAFHCSDPQEDPEELDCRLDSYAEAVMDRIYEQDEVHPTYHDYPVNEESDINSDIQSLPFVDPTALHPMYTCDLDTFISHYLPQSQLPQPSYGDCEDFELCMNDPDYCAYPRPHHPYDDFSDEELAAGIARLTKLAEEWEEEEDDGSADTESQLEEDHITPATGPSGPPSFTTRLFAIATNRHSTPRYFLGPPVRSFHRTTSFRSSPRPATSPRNFTHSKLRTPDNQLPNSLPIAPNIHSKQGSSISAQRPSLSFQRPRHPPRTRPRRKHPPSPPKQPQPPTIPQIFNHGRNAERRISNKISRQLQNSTQP